MRLALGLDFETEVLDVVNPAEMHATEIGVVLWDIDAKLPVAIDDTFVQWRKPREEFSPKITELTGITLEQLDLFGVPAQMAFASLASLIYRDDVLAVVAHNGKIFDEIIFNSEMARLGLSQPDVKKPWIDTMTDIPYPERVATRKLEYLAAAHGFLNPYSHRAIFDVLTMLRVMSNYNFDEVLRNATEKKFKVRALTKKPWDDNGVSNALAKDRGFKFDGATKHWLKNVRESQLEAELTKEPLQVILVEEIV